jgi:putative FmdB family regulatory protein
MPLYEYECGACGDRFEIIQKFSDAPITECPKCRGTLRKLQSAPAFQLKGTGWYATDYAKAGQTPAEKDSGGSSDSSSDKGAAKGDKSEKTGKSDNAEKTGTTEKTEKTASGDSAAPTTPSKTPSKES